MQDDPRVFLCHSSVDKPLVRRLGENLERCGVRVWLDEWELRVGDSLRQRIEEGVLSSGWLVIILSKASVDSEWVKRELSAAFARELELQRVFVLPALVEDCDLPLFLRDKLYADFRSDYKAGFEALLTSIEGHIAGRGRRGADETTGGEDNKVDWWWGRWIIEHRGPYGGGQATIREVDETGFMLDLSVYNGTHTGEIGGRCAFLSESSALLKQEGGEESCEIKIRRVPNQKAIIRIVEGLGCQVYHGMRASFDGRYVRDREPLIELGLLHASEADVLVGLMGERYWNFRDTFHDVTEGESLDVGVSRVIVGGVPGLYTTMEAILMIGPENRMWAAYLDSAVVRYYTTENKSRAVLPRTIESWRERFSEKRIIRGRAPRRGAYQKIRRADR